MSYEDYKNTLPDFAKDIKLNLSSLHNQFEQQGLTKAQFYGAALAVAHSLKNASQVEIYESLVDSLDRAELKHAAKVAATLMAMNNVYYRTIHLAEDNSLSKAAAGLRMNGLRDHGIDQTDFEVFALAVSAINGCGLCIKSHIKQLMNQGVSSQSIQTIIRLSAVLSAADQAESIPN